VRTTDGREEVVGHGFDVCLQHLIIHLPQADFDLFRQIGQSIRC
jgi:hypothetical protein